MWFAIDTLEYLRRGGRIAGAQAWLGSALKIKPILTVESEITPVERVRTSRRAFERMVDLLRSCHEAAPTPGWSSTSRPRPRRQRAGRPRAREIFGVPTRASVSEIGPVIGTHVGPGPARRRRDLPSSFLDSSRSPDLARRRARERPLELGLAGAEPLRAGDGRR